MARDDLTTYRKKRDFTKTAEPSGKAKVARSNQPRFVIQKHAATRLHYDLRLELDGVFKSWAVTRGPSLDPKQKRLAVEVEDHPLDYGDFEGVIPKGQYGGGTVEIWDRGYWLSDDPHKGLAKGDFKFALLGEKLKGEWVLVRMKHDRTGSKRTNWLLIKHRDEFSQDGSDEGVLDQDRSVASGRTIEQIAKGEGSAPKPFIMSKRTAGSSAVWDSRKGLAAEERARAEKPLARAKPAKAAAPRAVKTMPDFVAPQLCEVAAKPPSGEGWVHEIKFDGYRTQLRIEDHEAIVNTRKGLDWSDKFATIASAAAKLPDALIDGEIVALDANGTPNFSALQAAISDEKTGDLVFFAFDLLFAEGEDLRALPLIERKQRLEAILKKHTRGKAAPIRYAEHFAADADAILESARASGLEGIISKQSDAPYKSGRARSWKKIKVRPGHEVVVGGWKTTGGKFRSLMVGVNHGDDLLYTGIVGTGYGRDIVKQIMPALKKAASKTSPFSGKNAPKGGRDVHWLKPELVAEIEFAGFTADGSVRQASFKGLRSDKPAREVRADATHAATPDLDENKTKRGSAKAQARAARYKAARGGSSRSARPADVHGITISKPDKPLWPDGGDGEPVTKRDLAQYFEAVAEWMLPHIAGRPCSIVRAPDGIKGETFFQRHAMPGQSEHVGEIKLSDDRKPYIKIDTVEGLIAVAQSGGLELHPSNCAPDAPTVPGRLIFDLDPSPDVAFDEVIATARAMKPRLEALGLTAFCKTTGGKGLHVVTPLLTGARDRVTWPQAKAFAQEVCRLMAEAEPDRYLIKMSKAARKGKIFLDYLRNDRKSTAVAPLSPRARPSAPVSMPVTWAQVKAGLDPLAFTVGTVPDLLKRSKAWAGYDDAAASLKAAMKKLG